MRQHLLTDGRLLVLREAEPDDAAKLLVYIEQVAGESENLTFEPGEFEMGIEQEQAFLRASAQSPTSLYLIAICDDEIVGSLSFSAGNRLRKRHVGEFGISVARAFWGMGIGGYMLNYLLVWARDGGIIRKINLQVRVDNSAAIHLYEKRGFVHEGRISRGLYVLGEFIDLYAMGLQIDPPGVLK